MEKYAQFPHAPELLKLEEVPSLWKGVIIGWFVDYPLAYALIVPVLWILNVIDHKPPEIQVLGLVLILVSSVWAGTGDHRRAKAANGNRPLENARRQKAYEEARITALKAAELNKAAQVHRLRCQIRDLEGSVKTAAEKEAEIRRILEKL